MRHSAIPMRFYTVVHRATGGFLRPIKSIVIGLVIACALTSYAWAETSQHCEISNHALQAMPIIDLWFEYANGEKFQIKVKLANRNSTRAAGFQRVCAATIGAQPILFVFENEVRPRFHMRNVVAPIDIAFIQKGGKIDSIQAMPTYILGRREQPLYSPAKKVVAALETHPGFYAEHGVDHSVSIKWQLPVK